MRFALLTIPVRIYQILSSIGDVPVVFDQSEDRIKFRKKGRDIRFRTHCYLDMDEFCARPVRGLIANATLNPPTIPTFS